MYSITIGKTFLTAFNEKYQKNYTPRLFFEKEFFPVFFDHPKYMLWHTNSPFVQMKKGQKPHLLTGKERLEKRNDLDEKIKAGDRDASVAIGFPASEAKAFATTSGLVSDIAITAQTEDIYLSWIAAGLGIGVSGGYCIFLDTPDLLLDLYDGWEIYRSLLNDPVLGNVAPNKINTWNGQWINYLLGKTEGTKIDIPALARSDMFKRTKDSVAIQTVNWSKLFFNLSKRYPGQTLIAYIYSLGQTNKTIGFIPFYLKAANRLVDYYERLFGENAALEDSQSYESLFGTHIKRACELGTIGMHALQPGDLKKYFVKGQTPKFKKPKIPPPKKNETDQAYQERKTKSEDKDRENIILYRTYKTWLVAMITKNKEEMLDYTGEIAKVLLKYREGSRKTDRKNLIEGLLTAKSKKEFIKGLIKAIKDMPDEFISLVKDLRDRVHLMTAEDFGYFVVLLRFDYAYEERND